MFHKSDDYRRHQEQRVIARRLKIVTTEWSMSPNWVPIPHRYAKYNLTCPCWMCQGESYRRQKEERKSQEVQALAWGVAV